MPKWFQYYIRGSLWTSKSYCIIYEGPLISASDPAVLEGYIKRNPNSSLVECGICGKEDKYKNNLRKHIESIHFPGQFVYTCQLCGKEFNGKNSLAVHMSNTHRGKREVQWINILSFCNCLQQMSLTQNSKSIKLRKLPLILHCLWEKH